MEEAQELADRVAVIAAGSIVAQGDPATIGGRDTARARIEFTLPDGCAPSELPIVPSTIADRLVTLEADDPTEVLHRLTAWALHRGHTLPDLVVQRPSLEDVYLQLTGESAASSAAEETTPRRGLLIRSGR